MMVLVAVATNGSGHGISATIHRILVRRLPVSDVGLLLDELLLVHRGAGGRCRCSRFWLKFWREKD